MANSVRHIQQRFWHNKHIAHLTIRSTYNSIQGYKAHSHAQLSIGIIESGITCLSLHGQQVILNKGDAILIEPHRVHACDPVAGKPRSYHMLYIDNNWCCEVLSALYGYKVSLFTCDQALLLEREVTQKLSALLATLREDENNKLILEIDNLLFNLVSFYCSPSINEDNDCEFAYQVKERLLKDITSAPSLDEISQLLGRPKESIIRIFKRRFGITPNAFLNNHRIEKAKFLLRSGMSIVDVAFEVGYSDQSQLHRAFVSYVACTPRQYSVNFRQ